MRSIRGRVERLENVGSNTNWLQNLSDEELAARLIDHWRRVALSDAIPLDLIREVLAERERELDRTPT